MLTADKDKKMSIPQPNASDRFCASGSVSPVRSIATAVAYFFSGSHHHHHIH